MITEERKTEAYAMNVRNLRRRASAVYLACDEAVAKDISAALLWAADEIDRLSAMSPAIQTPIENKGSSQ